MSLVADEQIAIVRARADIADVIGEFLSLKKTGEEYRAYCPFHDDIAPALYVTPAARTYGCATCGDTGDVFAFLMKRARMGFSEAVRFVAARAGVEP